MRWAARQVGGARGHASRAQGEILHRSLTGSSVLGDATELALNASGLVTSRGSASSFWGRACRRVPEWTVPTPAGFTWLSGEGRWAGG